MDNKTCDNCYYFQSVSSKFYDGRCMRFPPVALLYVKNSREEYVAEFGHTLVCTENFCGEWKEKTDG